jgi:hypothetical protein
MAFLRKKILLFKQSNKGAHPSLKMTMPSVDMDWFAGWLPGWQVQVLGVSALSGERDSSA